MEAELQLWLEQEFAAGSVPGMGLSAATSKALDPVVEALSGLLLCRMMCSCCT
jgi:hypothetical protein